MATKQNILEKAKTEKRTLLTEIESKELLKQAGIDVVETRLAASKEEAIAISGELKFPVALKIVSPDITHKSDAGGVKLGLKTANQVGKAYDDILASVKSKNPQAVIHGVSVQKMASPGVEVIMGMFQDPQFGPVLMFGLGGVFVEVLKDVSFRLVPLTRRDAQEMVREIKGFQLLAGFRGHEPVAIHVLENWLLKLSDFIAKNEDIKELDLNPVIAYPDCALAVDARVVIQESK
ncbi:MAG: acetate--CoA ligase family protein [Chloroflexi bacterium]|nr:acetate--CoA ligase family protein [Chloroflexota bacterium]